MIKYVSNIYGAKSCESMKLDQKIDPVVLKHLGCLPCDCVLNVHNALLVRSNLSLTCTSKMRGFWCIYMALFLYMYLGAVVASPLTRVR